MRWKIKTIASSEETDILEREVKICGWIRTVRAQKNFTFVTINDGSNRAGMQVILSPSLPDYTSISSQLSTGSSVAITGKIVKSPGKEQLYEMQATKVDIHQICPPDYPLQKKRHSNEFLRTIAHLRPRTNLQGAISRVRNCLAMSTHSFFQKNGFLYLQTPIITTSDCEGGGDLFHVTTLNLDAIPKNADKYTDYTQDFFSTPTFLTVSGQLNAEAYACALCDVYTFGPTFRAENSHTTRHLAEFWMIEPEMAFADLHDIVQIAEQYLQYLIQEVLKTCHEDLALFDQFVEKGLIERLNQLACVNFAHLTYTEAVAILKKSKASFHYPVNWGCDLQTEHERHLTDIIYQKPVVITDYPKDIKAFYMRSNSDDKTVAAFDLLVPKVGELIGGSQREERLAYLEDKVQERNLDLEKYQWYFDLRRFGSVPHSGFGLGFERLVQFVCGVENIRDVVAFPRVSGSALF